MAHLLTQPLSPFLTVREAQAHAEGLKQIEKAKATRKKQERETTDKLVKEINQNLTKLRRAEQQSPIEEVLSIARMSREELEALSLDDWKSRAEPALRDAQIYWTAEKIAPPDASEFEVLVNFLLTNGLDPGYEFNWITALETCIEKKWLRVPTEKIEQPPAEPEPEPGNPHKINSYQWHQWELHAAQRDVDRELSPLFRGVVEEICRDSGGLEFSSQNMRSLMDMWQHSHLPWDRASLRRVFFRKWGKECPPNVMTPEEKQIWEIDTNDQTSKEFARSLGRPTRG